MKRHAFSKYYTNTRCVSLIQHMTHDLHKLYAIMEAVCFGGSQIGRGPKAPDRVSGQEHHSELIPTNRLLISEWKYNSGRIKVWCAPRCTTFCSGRGNAVFYLNWRQKKKKNKIHLCYSCIQVPGRRSPSNLTMSSIQAVLVTFP